MRYFQQFIVLAFCLIHGFAYSQEEQEIHIRAHIESSFVEDIQNFKAFGINTSSTYIQANYLFVAIKKK